MAQVQNYWSKKANIKKHMIIYPKLVPNYGEADTPEGELLRIISKIYYRYHNDGDIL